MWNRNAQPECILIKLSALELNVSVKELPNFMRKCYLIAELLLIINLQIPMTKYLGFQYSVNYCSHLSGSDVVL